MDYKVVEVDQYEFYSQQVLHAENEAQSMAKKGWCLISSVFTDRNSIILFFERENNDEEN